jgi:preprotein translocase subunit SecG
VVLLQKSEGGGLGMGGGGGGFLSSRGSANVLTRTTAILAAGFFLTSLALSIIAGIDRKPRSIIGNSPAEPAAPTAPGAPLPPLQIPPMPSPGAPAGPPAGGVPQVPRSQ